MRLLTAARKTCTSYIFTRIDPAAKPEDTLNAYKGLLHAAEALNKGESNYKVIADNNGVKYGDMGFITVFQLPYEYENIAYSLKPGQTNKPYRSKMHGMYSNL